MKKLLILLLLVCGTGVHYAAEFDLYGPSIELRRMQFCHHCGIGLVVTTVGPGIDIRCPGCSTVQKRIPTKHILHRVFQVCPDCHSPMDVHSFKPRSWLRCGTCGTPQQVLSEATRRFVENGKGYLPAGRPVRLRLSDPELEMPSSPKQFKPRSQPAMIRAVAVPGIVSSEDMRKQHWLDQEPLPKDLPVPAIDESSFDSNRLSSVRNAALVNSRPIPVADVERELTYAMERLRLGLGRAAYTENGAKALSEKKVELREKILRSLINRMLVLEAAEAEGFTPDEKQVLRRADRISRKVSGRVEYATLLESARVVLVIEEMKKRHTQTPRATPADIREYYRKNRVSFMQPLRVRMHTIVIMLDRAGRDPRPASVLAKEIDTALTRGAKFSILLPHYDESPLRGKTYRINGDPLVPVMMLSGPVQTAVGKGRPGAVVGPIPLVSSIAFCKIEEIVPERPLPLDAVSADIEKVLVTKAGEAAFDSWVSGLRAQAQVTTY